MAQRHDAVVFGRQPVLIGHRGCGDGIVRGHAENTLDSFLAAVELGAEWLEVDVRRAADDTLLVEHSPANRQGTFFTDITGAQATARGSLPLDVLLERLPDGVGVDLDLKSSMEDAVRERSTSTAALLAPLAQRETHRRPVLVTSFDPSALDILRDRAPGVPRGFLTWLHFPIGHAVAAAAHLDVQVLAVHGGSLRPNPIEPEPQCRPLEYIVDVVHKSGRQLLAWCPGDELIQQLVADGADALCVNDIGAVAARLGRGRRAVDSRRSAGVG